MPIVPPYTGASVPTTRLPNESAKAYAAFRAYAEMGAERSLTKLRQKLNKSREFLGMWSSKYQWQERIRTWDAEETARDAEARAAAALEAAKLREQRKTELMERVWTLQEKIAERLTQMLAFPVGKTTVNNKDGTTTIVMPGKWTYADVTRAANAIAQLGAFATGMTKKLTDPDTGSTVGDDDKPHPPAGMVMPKIVFEVVQAPPAQPSGDVPPPAKEQQKQPEQFTFSRS